MFQTFLSSLFNRRQSANSICADLTADLILAHRDLDTAYQTIALQAKHVDLLEQDITTCRTARVSIMRDVWHLRATVDQMKDQIAALRPVDPMAQVPWTGDEI